MRDSAFWGRWGRGVRWLRWPIVVAWVAVAVYAGTQLPTIDEVGAGTLGSLVPRDAEAVKAELVSKERFGFPLLSRTLLVQRDPSGMAPGRQAAAVRRALALSQNRVPGLGSVKGALPVTNAFGAPPFSREHSTTVLTYLFVDPDLSISSRAALARRLVAQVRAPPGEFVGATGQAPATVEQRELINRRLPLIELATVLLVAFAVGLRIRALGAPLVTLAAIGVAYVVASHVVAWAGRKAGFAVPEEVQPVMVVLIFGVVTDYSIFFVSRMRAILSEGAGRSVAAERTTAELSPVVLAAGATVAAATCSLLVARLQFFRVFGPGMAFSVLVSLVVAMTLVPALLAIFGRAVFWPSLRSGEAGAPDGEDEQEPGRISRRRPRFGAARLATRHPWATAIACVALLAVAAGGLLGLRLSNPVVRGLPHSSSARSAYAQASRGLAPGILSPTVAVLTGPGITSHRRQLARVQAAVGRQPGVALVLGPSEQPVHGLRLGATLARDGDAARLFVVFDTDPLGARAIDDLEILRRRLPAILRAVGLPRARTLLAGDTALSGETIDKTVGDLKRVAPVALGVIFLILALFLRALVAPLYLVFTSLCAFGAALGLGSYLFQGLLGYQGVTYFVPFAVAVLLVSLGSDYNVFLIGRIWQEAGRDGPWREAVLRGSSRAARSITLAGLVLAGSFALVALVPVRAFYELAFMMAAGLLLDAFVVRTLLVPALAAIVGPASAWPGRQPHAGADR